MQALAVKATEAETQRLQMQLMCEHEVVQATMQFLVDKTISGHLHEQQANEIDALNRRVCHEALSGSFSCGYSD